MKKIKIFTMKQQLPCGPNSSCCRPIGQSEEEVTALKNEIEKLGTDVEIYDVQKVKDLQEYPQVFKLLRTFGPQAIPVISVDNEVASIGMDSIDEVISAIKSKL